MDTAGHHLRERLPNDRQDIPAGLSLSNAIRFLPEAMFKLPWSFDFMLDGFQIDAPMGRTRDGKKMTMLEAMEEVFSPGSPTPTWEDIGWIRDIFKGPIIVKGIQNPEDARKAVDLGADAIVVSNHGGMVSDGAPATMRSLPAVLDAVGDRTEVLMDGGIRAATCTISSRLSFWMRWREGISALPELMLTWPWCRQARAHDHGMLKKGFSRVGAEALLASCARIYPSR